MKTTLSLFFFLPFLLLLENSEVIRVPSNSPHCISHQLHQNQKKEIAYLRRTQQINEHYTQFVESKKSNTSFQKRINQYTIPTVVHLVSLPNQPPINDNDVRQGLEIINKAFRGEAACPQNNAGVDTGIQLCLAQRTIDGDFTSGIEKYESTLSDLDLCSQEVDLKNLTQQGNNRFPSSDYLNIWLVNSICASCDPLGCDVAGFATFPAAHGSDLDGFVQEMVLWNPADCELAITGIHEMGHWLNLLHTFEGGCKNDNCLVDGDKVCDTPPDNDQNFYASHPCLSGEPQNSCNSDVNAADPNNPFSADVNDLTNNYMDYTPPACGVSFTQGQITRMEATITGVRASLLDSKGCLPPCSNEIIVDIQLPDTVQVGEIFNPTNNTSGALNFNWTVNGINFTQAQPSISFDTTGLFNVQAIASNGDAECREIFTKTIRVICPLSAAFSVDNRPKYADDVANFEFNGNNPSGSTYEWLVNGVISGSGTTFSHTFSDLGATRIQLRVCNNDCCTLSTDFFNIGGFCLTGKEANVWVIRGEPRVAETGTIMDFANDPPLSNDEPNINASPEEYRPVANDAAGNLLFYSDGDFVYNHNHDFMAFNLKPNGFPIEVLKGGHSATQGLTIQHPTKDYLWYLLSPSESGYINGRTRLKELHFFKSATIDMRLDNGQGDLVSLDTLFSPSAEKVAATRHCNGTDWWIVAHEIGSNCFRAYLLDSTGIHKNDPVISCVGIDDGYFFGGGGTGAIKFSPNGKFLAAAMGGIFDSSRLPVKGNRLELFEFDNSTGIIHNPKVILDSLSGTAYSVEFSPDNSKLYFVWNTVTSDTLSLPWFNWEGLGTGRIRTYQFDMEAGDGNIDSIQRSMYLCFRDNHLAGGLQTGPDGKIYVGSRAGNYGGVDVIHAPNEKGAACNYENKGLAFVNPNHTPFGLPSFPNNSVFNPNKPHISGNRKICIDEPLQTYHVESECLKEVIYRWEVEGANISASKDTANIRFDSVGIYDVIVEKFWACGAKTDTIQVNVTSCETCDIQFAWRNVDTTVCQGENAFVNFSRLADSVFLKNENTGKERLIENSIIGFDNPQIDSSFSLRIVSGNCDTIVSFGLHVNPPQIFEWLNADTNICVGSQAILDFDTDAQLIELINQNTEEIRTNPTLPLAIDNVQSDSCYDLRLRNNLNSCDELIRFCIHTVDDAVVFSDSIEICQGDTIEVFEQPVFENGFFEKMYQTTAGCDSLVQVQVEVLDVLSSDETLSICEGDSAFIFNNWQTSAGLFEQSFSSSGGCDSIHQVVLEVNDLEIFISNSIDIEKGTATELTVDFAIDSVVIQWFPTTGLSCSDCPNPIAAPNTSTQYQVFVTDQNGCSTSAFVTVNVLESEPEPSVFIPSGFSPNNDGINDFLTVFASSGIVVNYLRVFDRWGNLVFERINLPTNIESQGWDGKYKGKPLDGGVYLWVAEVVFPNTDDSTIEAGEVLLWR